MITQAAFALLQGAKDIRVALVAAGLRIAEMLTEKYPPPVVGGRPLFDYGKQVQHLVYELETAESNVLAAENAHMRHEVRLSRLRTEREQKTAVGLEKLLAARQGLDGLQGAKGGFETAYVSGSAPRRPRRLLEQMGQTVTLLKEPAVEPRVPRVAGFGVDYLAVAGDLESSMTDLRTTVDQLDEQNKLAEGTMLARQQATDELRSTVIWAGRTAEGLFTRAGEHELAKRIRASTSRPSRPSEQTEESPAGGDSTAGEPASEPASEPVSGSTEPQSSAS